MKTNLLHILLVAVVLLIGWSVSIILQDYYHTKANESSNPISMFELTKKYLPQIPENNYIQQEKLTFQESNQSDSAPKRDKSLFFTRLRNGNLAQRISTLNMFDKQSDGGNTSGNPNAFFFIDIPVGDGLVVLLFMSFLLYVPYKLLKKDML